MRKARPLICTVLLVSVFGTVYAGLELGPASPQSARGRFSLSAGYSYQTSRWATAEDDDITADFLQDIWYACLAYGFAANWEGYVRIGAVDLTGRRTSFCVRPTGVFAVLSCFLGEVETGFEPYLSLGVRGSFYCRPELALGAWAQFNYYSDSRVEESGTEWTFDGYVNYEAVVEFKDMYDLNAGVSLDLIGYWGLLHVGAFYYKGAGTGREQLEWKVDPEEVYTFTSDIEEKGSIGINSGLRVILTRGWHIAIEGQYKEVSKAGVSVSLSKAFGA